MNEITMTDRIALVSMQNNDERISLQHLQHALNMAIIAHSSEYDELRDDAPGLARFLATPSSREDEKQIVIITGGLDNGGIFEKDIKDHWNETNGKKELIVFDSYSNIEEPCRDEPFSPDDPIRYGNNKSHRTKDQRKAQLRTIRASKKRNR